LPQLHTTNWQFCRAEWRFCAHIGHSWPTRAPIRLNAKIRKITIYTDLIPSLTTNTLLKARPLL